MTSVPTTSRASAARSALGSSSSSTKRRSLPWQEPDPGHITLSDDDDGASKNGGRLFDSAFFASFGIKEGKSKGKGKAVDTGGSQASSSPTRRRKDSDASSSRSRRTAASQFTPLDSSPTLARRQPPPPPPPHPRYLEPIDPQPGTPPVSHATPAPPKPPAPKPKREPAPTVRRERASVSLLFDGEPTPPPEDADARPKPEPEPKPAARPPLTESDKKLFSTAPRVLDLPTFPEGISNSYAAAAVRPVATSAVKVDKEKPKPKRAAQKSVRAPPPAPAKVDKGKRRAEESPEADAPPEDEAVEQAKSRRAPPPPRKGDKGKGRAWTSPEADPPAGGAAASGGDKPDVLDVLAKHGLLGNPLLTSGFWGGLGGSDYLGQSFWGNAHAPAADPWEKWRAGDDDLDGLDLDNTPSEPEEDALAGMRCGSEELAAMDLDALFGDPRGARPPSPELGDFGPVASTSKARALPPFPDFPRAARKTVRAHSRSSSSLASPPVSPATYFSRETIRRRLDAGAGKGPGVVVSSDDEGIIVAAPQGYRAAPLALGGGGKGKAKAMEALKAKRKAKERRDGKKARKGPPEVEYWREMEVEKRIRGVKVPTTWSPPEPYKLDDRWPEIGSVEIRIHHAVFRNSEVYALLSSGDCEATLRASLVQLPFEPAGKALTVASSSRQVVLKAADVPAVPQGHGALAPTGPFAVRLPLSPSEERQPLTLRLQLIAGRTSFVTEQPLRLPNRPTPPAPTPVHASFHDQSSTTTGLSLTLVYSPSPPPTLEPPSVIDKLNRRLKSVALDHTPQATAWLPDAVTVSLPKERDMLVMPAIGGGRMGHDFITKEPLEPGDAVRPFLGHNSITSASLIADNDNRILSTSHTDAEKLIARMSTRWAILNPFPPTAFDRELACWRFYAPIVHHHSLRPALTTHLLERLHARGLLSNDELREVLRAYDIEVRKLERGQRKGYEEWKRRKTWRKEQKGEKGLFLEV
ncbi:hypothetical protein JCM10207_009244 [Rhodosporidiobolus poonsookiae]